ncbi:hypothetical protein FFR93_36020 [Rhizobium sp. MHM7A]|nr:hypothetical protein FFR93_36020 [Rhizobium sp. MHM7A]
MARGAPRPAGAGRRPGGRREVARPAGGREGGGSRKVGRRSRRSGALRRQRSASATDAGRCGYRFHVAAGSSARCASIGVGDRGRA